ncbi:MAG: hypothetical protein HRT87_04480 [Legionellales bacterium]|nr:hypothetical protein [Legionellales bacterium]
MKLWNGQQGAFEEALNYMKKRQIGAERSILTPWAKVNDATVDGLEWNSTNIIAARPGSGKTLIKDQIIRESFMLNPQEDFRVLEFQFEMVGRSSAIREFSSITGYNYKQLTSAEGTLPDHVLKQCHDYAIKRVRYPVDVISKPLTVEGLREQVDMYINEHNGKKTIITLDHTILTKKSPRHKSTQDMLFDLGEFFTQTKRDYPVLFIVLSQLNRNVETPERAINGKYGNYINEQDIFGSDAMLQHADTLIGVNRPAKRQIKYYGPQKYIIDDDSVLVFHFLKVRNGDSRMSFFKAKFAEMRIEDMPVPQTQRI